MTANKQSKMQNKCFKRTVSRDLEMWCGDQEIRIGGVGERILKDRIQMALEIP
jgi:hypothetical protein